MGSKDFYLSLIDFKLFEGNYYGLHVTIFLSNFYHYGYLCVCFFLCDLIIEEHFLFLCSNYQISFLRQLNSSKTLHTVNQILSGYFYFS